MENGTERKTERERERERERKREREREGRQDNTSRSVSLLMTAPKHTHTPHTHTHTHTQGQRPPKGGLPPLKRTYLFRSAAALHSFDHRKWLDNPAQGGVITTVFGLGVNFYRQGVKNHINRLIFWCHFTRKCSGTSTKNLEIFKNFALQRNKKKKMHRKKFSELTPRKVLKMDNSESYKFLIK